MPNINETLERLDGLYAQTESEWDYDGMHNEIHGREDYYLIVSELRYHPGEIIEDRFGHAYNFNFDFIAESHNAYPALRDEIRRLQGILTEIDGVIAEFYQGIEDNGKQGNFTSGADSICSAVGDIMAQAGGVL